MRIKLSYDVQTARCVLRTHRIEFNSNEIRQQKKIMKEQRSYQIVQIQFNFIFKTKSRVSVDVCNLPKLSPVAFTTELQVTFLFRIFRGWPSVYLFPQKKLANDRENAGQRINVSSRLLLFVGTCKKLEMQKQTCHQWWCRSLS